MKPPNDYVVVITTTENEQDAEDLAEKILENRLAACIQVQQIKSYYSWKGSIRNDPECLLLIKTRADLFEKLEKFILSNHKYETPEIIQIPITNGFTGYLNWIDAVING